MNVQSIKAKIKKLEIQLGYFKSPINLRKVVWELVQLEAKLERMEVELKSETVELKSEKKTKVKIPAVCYRRKGNHAYLSLIEIKEGIIINRNFYNPDEYEDDERRYKGQSVECWFHLYNKPDGYYILREGAYSGRKQYFSYLLIENGDISKEFETEKEMLSHASKNTLEGFKEKSEFPDLEGSPRQVDWAENIREECNIYGLPADFFQTSAKYWIDNWRNPYKIKRMGC